MSPKKRKVLHFIDSGGLYGAESVILNLSGIMASSGRYEPVVGCIVSHIDDQNDLYEKAREMGLPAAKIVIRNTMLALDIPRAARQFKSLGVELIHSHGYKPSVFGYAIKKLTGIEVMSTCHLWFKQSKRPLKMKVMIGLEMFLYKSFEIVVGVSEPIKDALISSGVSGTRILVIPNGVPVGNELIASTQILQNLRNELRLNEKDFCLINTGRLTRQKAQCDLIAAAEILRDQGVSLRCLIVGEGELREELQRQISEAHLDGIVTLLGFREDITALLQIADLFVLPSLDEGMPMSLLEAAALGLPVATTLVGDIPKLITNQISGLTIPKGDPATLAETVLKQINDRDSGRKLGNAAKEQVRRIYSSEAMFIKYDMVYSRLMG